MTTTHNLPVELLRPIFQQIDDPSTLASLCLSNKLFHSEAQTILYHFPPNFHQRPAQHIHLLTCLHHTPHLALLIKTYRIPSITGKQKATFWALLCSVLPMMVNLTELWVVAFSQDLTLLPMDKIVCQLDALTWIQVDSEASGMFPKWLATQKNLKKLKWICRGQVEVAPSACPELVCLEGNFHVISALLPGRCVKRLRWIADVTLKGCALDTLMKELCGAFRNLESLSFESDFSAVDFHSFADSLSSLTVLEIIGNDKELIANIPLPTNIHILILSIQKGYAKTATFPFAASQRPTTARAMLAKSASKFLQRVDIAAQLVENDVLYERWERGGRMEGLVTSEDVLRALSLAR